MDSPPKPPVIVYRAAAPRLQKLMKGLSSADLDIARRLEKLREDRHASKCVPTEDEIARRLAVLKGEDIQDLSKKPIYVRNFPPVDLLKASLFSLYSIIFTGSGSSRHSL